MLLQFGFFDELKVNAISVPSILGGGMFGHVGLLFTPDQYVTLLYVPFNHPTNTGPVSSSEKANVTKPSPTAKVQSSIQGSFTIICKCPQLAYQLQLMLFLLRKFHHHSCNSN